MARNNARGALHERPIGGFTIGRGILILILVVGLVPRLAYIGLFGRDEWRAWPDSRHYERIGWRLAQGSGYDSPEESPPAIYRPPLVPFIIGSVYSITGRRPLAVQLLQAILGALACVFVGLSAARLYGCRVGVAAALTTALYPHFVYLPAVFYPEAVGVVLVGLCMLLFIANADRIQLRLPYMVALGFCTGLGALCRPNWLLTLPLLIPAVYAGRRVRGLASPMGPGAAAVLAWVVVWAPWTARNFCAYGAPVLITCGGGLNFYLGNNPHATWNSKTDVPKPAIMNDLRSDRPQDLDREFYQLGLEYVRKNPGRTIQLWLGKLINYWQPLPEIKDHPIGLLAMAVATIPSVAVLLGALCGVVAALLRRDCMLVILLAVPLIDSSVTAIFITPSRLRIPFDSILILAGVVCVASLRSGQRAAARKPLEQDA